MDQEAVLRTPPHLVRGVTSQRLPYFYTPDTQGGVVVVSEQIASLVDSVGTASTLLELATSTGRPVAELEPTIAFLVSRGLLSSAAPTRPLVPLAGIGPAPGRRAQLWFHVTNACNLRCRYCYVDKDTTGMTVDDAVRIAEKVCRDAFAHGYDGINLKFAGGEPLVGYAEVQAIVARIEQLAEREPQFRSVTFSILTNATLVTPEIARYLRDKNIIAGVGLDGIGAVNDRERVTSSGRGSFDRALAGIRHLTDVDMHPAITCVVTPSNVEDLEGFITAAAGWGCTTRMNPVRDTAVIRQLVETGQFEPFLDTMIEHVSRAFRAVATVDPRPIIGTHDFADLSLVTPRTGACNVGRDSGAINQYGQVASCQEWLEQPFTPPDGENTFATIQAQQLYDFAGQFAGSNPCASCEWRSVCNGGCPSLKQHFYGRIDVPSPYCRVFKAVIPLMVALSAEQTARSVRSRAPAA